MALPSRPRLRRGLTLEDKQATTSLLLACGANIVELNAIRKHLSRLKGGGLARAAFPATVVALMLSDVIGDPLDVIASGPTVPDTATFQTCMDILDKYELRDQIPDRVRSRLEAGVAGEIEDTPKPGDVALSKVQNLIVGSNGLAVAAANDKANALGYRTLVLSTRIEGEAREVAYVYAGIAKEIATSAQPIAPPACVIAGGETTVLVRRQGQGRAQPRDSPVRRDSVGWLGRCGALQRRHGWHGWPNRCRGRSRRRTDPCASRSPGPVRYRPSEKQ